MSTKLRVGVVGLGGNGGQFLEAYATNPRAEVAAICDVRDDHRRALQEKYGVPTGVADFAALLDMDDVDYVSIHAPDRLHAPFALAAIDAGKHVFVEKPMATSVEDCMRLVAAADGASTGVAVGHVLRTRPFYRAVKELVESGEMGGLYALRTHYLTNAMRQSPGFLTRANASYAPPMLTMGVHPVDLMRWYAGDIVAVSAMGNQGMAMPGNPIDDAVTAVYRFESGATGCITVCWASHYKFDSFYGLELHGSKASLLWDKIHRVEERQTSPVSVPPTTARPGYAAEVDSVVDSLLDDTPLFCDVREGARSAIACLIAIEAAATGATLDVPNP